jgi:hypothetical protein
MALPDCARESYDGIYRATDMYLEVVLWSQTFHVIWIASSSAYWILYRYISFGDNMWHHLLCCC